MNLGDFLTNAHLLCYDRRKAYWPGVEADLKGLGIAPRRWVMGSGSDPELSYDHIDRHGGDLPGRQRLNYLEGVQALLRRELDRGREYAACFEDDVALHGDAPGLLARINAQLAPLSFPFDFFYLHGVRALSASREVTPNVLKMDGCLGFRAVVLSRKAMGAILRLCPSPWKGIDGQIKDGVHPGMDVYSAYPCLLRADRDRWSYQHEREVKPEWLDLCVNEKGNPLR